MATYLLKWNPTKSPWDSLKVDVEEVRRRGLHDHRWSCGNSGRIRVGDRVFLLRTSKAPRGIIASGIVNEAPHEGRHWSPVRPKAKALYIGARFDILLDADVEPILAVERLKGGSLGEYFRRINNAPKSGLTIPGKTAAELEVIWASFLASVARPPAPALPEEVTTPEQFFEGALRQITINAYERNPAARRRCIEHYGCHCWTCGFDFEAAYGEAGQGFIHVHHLKPLAQIGATYEIDAVADLRPVCPNCHAIIHRGHKMMSADALREMLRRGGRNLSFTSARAFS